MNDLIFNPNKNKNDFGNKYYSRNQEIPKSKLAEWIIKLSGGKINEQKANYIMIFILILIILATIVVIYLNSGGTYIPEEIPAPAAEQ